MSTARHVALVIALAALVVLLGPLEQKAHAAGTPGYGSGPWGGTYSAPVRTGDPATADAVLFGDSIANRCTPALVSAFAQRGLKLAVVAQSGQRTDGLVRLMMQAPALPSRVVLEAGTNDVFAPPQVRTPLLSARIWANGHGVQLTLVDTYVHRTGRYAAPYRTADLRNSAWVNTYQHATGLPVIGWRAFITTGRRAQRLLADGVHPTYPACATYAAVVAGGIK